MYKHTKMKRNHLSNLQTLPVNNTLEVATWDKFRYEKDLHSKLFYSQYYSVQLWKESTSRK